jgi:hypothetical protein
MAQTLAGGVAGGALGSAGLAAVAAKKGKKKCPPGTTKCGVKRKNNGRKKVKCCRIEPMPSCTSHAQCGPDGVCCAGAWRTGVCCDNDQCDNPTPICNPATNQCEGCAADGQCWARGNECLADGSCQCCVACGGTCRDLCPAHHLCLLGAQPSCIEILGG